MAVKRHPYRVLAICLLAPAFAAVVRKIVPGQPAALEIGGIAAVLAGGGWLLLRRRILPRWVLIPILVWAYFQLVYAAFAINVDWRVGAVAILTRVAPMIMAGIAFTAVRNAEDFRKAARWLGYLAVALLPVGLIIIAFGDDHLPFLLQPIADLAELRRNERKGILAVTGVFTTQAVMSMSMLAVMFLVLAAAALAEEEGKSPRTWWFFAIAAITLVFLSTRRGAFIAAVIGLAVYMLSRDRVPTRLILTGGAAVTVALIAERLGTLGSRWGITRGQLLMDAFDVGTEIPFRLYDIFGKIFVLWILEAPFGSYLGFAGPEADALIGRERLFGYLVNVFEVGGAQLMAETGILGALLMPAVVGIMVWQGRVRSQGLRCRRAVNLLLLYQVLFFALYYLKEESIMTGVSMGQLTFWAVPGIVAALIHRENREHRYWKAVKRYHVLQSREARARV